MNSTFFPASPAVTQPFYELMLEKILLHHQRNPCQHALISANDPTHHITWLGLYEKAHFLATFLRQCEFGAGQICSLVLPNCWQFAVGFFGVALAGGALSFSSIKETQDVISEQIAMSNSTVIITDSKHLQKIRAAISGMTQVKMIICVTNDLDQSSLPEHVVRFDEATTETPELFKPDKSEFSPDDLLFLLFSSGTTSASKGVMITHGCYGLTTSMMHRISAQHIFPKFLDKYDPDEEYNLIGRPVNYPFGLMLMFRGMCEGVTSIFTHKLDAHSIAQAIQDYKIKQLYLVPDLLISLCIDPEFEQYDLSSLRFILSSGEICSEELLNKCLERFPNVKYVTQGYGMSEAGGYTTFPSMLSRKDLSSGIIPPNFQYKNELKIGEVGEICLRGPMMKGYLNRPLSEAFDDDGWYHTGDIGYFDDTQRLFIIDRLKHMIKVIPAELENVLLSHPKVKEAAIVGVKDAQFHEFPKAFIIKNDDSLTAEEVHEFMKEKVAAYKQLTGGIEFRADFPRTASGKIARRNLTQN